jgi:hypothetical protein
VLIKADFLNTNSSLLLMYIAFSIVSRYLTLIYFNW